MMKQINDPNVYVYRDFADPSEAAASTMRQQAASVGGADGTTFVNGNYYTEGWVYGILLTSVLKACGADCTPQKFNDTLKTPASTIDTSGLTSQTGFSSGHSFLHGVTYWKWDVAKQDAVPVEALPRGAAT
jgi:hypothetical protein